MVIGERIAARGPASREVTISGGSPILAGVMGFVSMTLVGLGPVGTGLVTGSNGVLRGALHGHARGERRNVGR
jgi:hypothetical protein